MWYLNKFAEQMLSKNKSYQIREILGMSFIEFAQKVAVTLGTWSMMNIEMVIKKYNPEEKKEEIEYYSLPIEITRVLLQKDIASLITATKEPVVLETILTGDFSQLLTLSHKIMRYSFTKSEDKSLSQLRNKDDISLRKLLEILPILYTKINSKINSEVIL
jgi:CRISPR-associated protein Cst1